MGKIWHTDSVFDTSRPRQNGRHFADDIFKRILLIENVSVLYKISLKYVPQGEIDNMATLGQIMAWHRTGDKPLSKPMLVWCTNEYMQDSASMSWSSINSTKIALTPQTMNIFVDVYLHENVCILAWL